MWQSVDIWTFSIPNFETSFMENENFFSKNWSTAFQLKALTLKTRHFHTKLPYQKNIITQIEWWVQTGPITKNGVLPVATLFLWKFCFLLTTSYKELIWCTNEPNAHIHTFCKRWSFAWRCFFPVSILKFPQFTASRMYWEKYRYEWKTCNLICTQYLTRECSSDEKREHRSNSRKSLSSFILPSWWKNK